MAINSPKLIKKSTKEYVCDDCDLIIPKGSSYLTTFVVGRVNWSSLKKQHKCHIECEELMGNIFPSRTIVRFRDGIPANDRLNSLREIIRHKYNLKPSPLIFKMNEKIHGAKYLIAYDVKSCSELIESYYENSSDYISFNELRRSLWDKTSHGMFSLSGILSDCIKYQINFPVLINDQLNDEILRSRLKVSPVFSYAVQSLNVDDDIGEEDMGEFGGDGEDMHEEDEGYF